jgi:glycosyltransferase involved in cell wall biosynthesis
MVKVPVRRPRDPAPERRSERASASTRPVSILHVVIRVAPTSEQFNEHCLPFVGERDLAICSFFPAAIAPPPAIAMFEGDGTLKGFWKALIKALDASSYDVVHVHAPQTAAVLLVASLSRRRSLDDVVVTIHNSYRNFARRNRALFPTLALYPNTVFCSHAALASIPVPLRALGRGRFSVIQNGVDTERVDRVLGSSPPQPDPSTFTVATVARLIARKDPSTLLRAFETAVGDAGRLVFIGGGELEDHIQAEADRLGVAERVEVTGLVPRDDVYRNVARADVCVSPSLGEGLPVAVLESMACGRPVILSDIEPHREIAVGAEFIPLVPPGDVDGFARELTRFREMTPAQRSELGQRCKRLVEDRFSLRSMHRLYGDVYARVLGGKAVRDETGKLEVVEGT